MHHEKIMFSYGMQPCRIDLLLFKTITILHRLYLMRQVNTLLCIYFGIKGLHNQAYNNLDGLRRVSIKRYEREMNTINYIYVCIYFLLDCVKEIHRL